ncbi:MAG: family 1 glycosylhydrolase [Steroidobacter sp.]
MTNAPELWGGIECTVNRVSDNFHDQLRRGGHDRRPCDLERIAALGIRRLRYPVLWERVAPRAPNDRDWRWTDQRLKRLRELGIEPIVGLLHHGSGPRYTDLLDDNFPQLFADYASAVAARYPWVRSYTPINEPLTTARFSALYGHWHPHKSDDRSFVRVLVNQCKATVLAMREIRTVNPSAQLIQTDDVGYTSSTENLAYQASFDNERRWLGWDLLCGRVDARHPLWDYLLNSGFRAGDAEFFLDHPCPPDIIGVNHYVTSDRHLSERRRLFPPETWGGNGRHRYADVAAVRALPRDGSGLTGTLRDAWDRYRLPLAITEVHLGCTREEQLRWLWQAWNSARQLRASGMDLRAVTAWALFGSFDWNSLLTRDDGYYEPGAFDVRGPTPRRTALAKLITALTTGAEFHPAVLLEQPGWWQRSNRLFATLGTVEQLWPRDIGGSTLLIIGGAIILRRRLEQVCRARGLRIRIYDQSDVTERTAERVLSELRPWASIELMSHSNGNDVLANACARQRIPFLSFPRLNAVATSTTLDLLHTALDLLIDGETHRWEELGQPYSTSGNPLFEPPAEPMPLPAR